MEDLNIAGAEDYAREMTGRFTKYSDSKAYGRAYNAHFAEAIRKQVSTIAPQISYWESLKRDLEPVALAFAAAVAAQAGAVPGAAISTAWAMALEFRNAGISFCKEHEATLTAEMEAQNAALGDDGSGSID